MSCLRNVQSMRNEDFSDLLNNLKGIPGEILAVVEKALGKIKWLQVTLPEFFRDIQ